MELKIKNIEELPQAAHDFIAAMDDRTVFAFHGEMGAGKTTFTTAICNVLGVKDNVGSPTFTIVNEYRSAAGEAIYHFDFYRINRLSEAMDIGLWEYFDSGALCLIEWPEMIEELLPEETLKVQIIADSPTARRIIF